MTLVEIDVTSTCPEFAIYISFLIAFIIVKSQYRHNNIAAYVASFKWTFIQTPQHLQFYSSLMKLFTVFFYITPAIVFVIWIAVLIFKINEGYSSAITPVSIGLVFVFIVLILFGRFQVEWSYYQKNKLATALLIIGFLSFIVYQLVLNFMSGYQYFGITSIFLFYDCLCIFILIALFVNLDKQSFVQFIKSNSVLMSYSQYQPIVNIKEHTEECEKNESYYPCFKEFQDIITIGAKSANDEENILLSGYHEYTNSISRGKITLLGIGVYLTSLALLVGYSFIIYYNISEYRKLGFVIILAVVSTDIFLYIYYKSVEPTAIELCLLAAAFRICLVSFSEYWIYGYCLLFLILGVLVSWHIATRNFPLVKIGWSKDPIASENISRNIIRKPEFLLVVMVIVFAVLVVILALVRPDGCPLPPAIIGYISLEFYFIAVITTAVIGAVLVLLCLFRLLLRKISLFREHNEAFIFTPSFTLRWIYIASAYIAALLCCITIYLISRDINWIVYGFLIPALVLVCINSADLYKNNDFCVYSNVLQVNENIKKMNQIIRKIEARYKESEEKVSDIKEIKLELSNSPKKSQSLDRVSLQQDSYDKIRKKRRLQEHKYYTDWDKIHGSGSAFFAFWHGMMLENDYITIIGIILYIVICIVLAVCVEVIEHPNRDAWMGVTVGMPFIIIGGVFSSFWRFLAKRMNFDGIHIFTLILTIILHYGYTALNLGIKNSVDSSHGIIFGIVYIFAIPIVIKLLLYIYYIAKPLKIKAFTVITIVWLVLDGAGLTVYLWILWSHDAGVITLLISIALLYMIITLGVYSYMYYRMPKVLYNLNIVLFIALIFVIMVYSWIVSSFSRFVSFSVAFHLLFGALLLIGLIRYVKIFSKIKENPILVSNWVTPIIKYRSIKGAFEVENGGALIIFIVAFAEMIWSFLLSVFQNPMQNGVSYGSLVMILIVAFYVSLISYSTRYFHDNKEHVNIDNIKNAWIQIKKHIIDNIEGINYSTRKTFKQLREEHQQLDTVLKSSTACYDIEKNERLFEIMKMESIEFVNEMLLANYFQLLVLSNAELMHANESRELINFVKVKSKKLKEAEIFINIDHTYNNEEQYENIAFQLQKLTQEKYLIYKKLRRDYKAEYNELEKIEKEKEELMARQMQLNCNEENKRFRQKKKKVEDQYSQNLNIYEMADSKYKYQLINAHYKENHIKFVDKDFRGMQMMGNNKDTLFRRAGPKEVPYIGKAEASDVHQGDLGDCYLLSSIAIIGNEGVKKMLYDPENFKDCGAYCVTFHRDGEEEDIIVDDEFPIDKYGNCIYATSEDSGELWPAILEKAYAKFHTNYDRIIGGQIHITLAELTGGIPIKYITNNSTTADIIWDALYKSYKEKHLLGAGTYRNVDEKTDGLVPGHAYSIIELAEYNKEKLLKLKNPHGSTGAEWMGDWGDSSSKWTLSSIKALKFSNKDDGFFWMDKNSFFNKFEDVYICKIFNDEKWGKCTWNVHYDETIPAITGRSVDISKIIQKAIYITYPCTLYITVEQPANEVGAQGSGLYPIIIGLIKDSDGKIITNSDDLLSENNIRTIRSPQSLKNITSEFTFNTGESKKSLTLLIGSSSNKISFDMVVKFYWCKEEHQDKDTLDKDTLDKDTLDKDTLHKDTLHKDTLDMDINKIVTFGTPINP